MKKNDLRVIATPATAMLFMVIAISGIMMFFHFFDRYVKELHEILGLALVGAALAHIVVHWNALKNYFAKKEFRLIAVVVIIASGIFIGEAISKPKAKGPDPKKIMMDSLIKADLHDSLKVLNIEYNQAITTLENAKVQTDSADSIDALATKNQKSPLEIIKVLIAK